MMCFVLFCFVLQILSHAVEEELRYEMDSLSRALRELLKQILQLKFKDRTSWDKDQMLKDRLAGELPQDEAFLVINAMNSPEESVAVTQKIQTLLSAKAAAYHQAVAAGHVEPVEQARTYNPITL